MGILSKNHAGLAHWHFVFDIEHNHTVDPLTLIPRRDGDQIQLPCQFNVGVDNV